MARGDVLGYARIVLCDVYGHVRLEALLIAAGIAAMWFAFFWRIDVFEQEPLWLCTLAVGLGMLSAPLSVALRDLAMRVAPLASGGALAQSLGRAVLHIGLAEETAKATPAVLVALLAREADEPLDVIIYGSLCALGFATVETARYVAHLGPGVAFSRALTTTVLHMALTAGICLAWTALRRGRGTWVALGAGLAALSGASVAHGLFDLGSPARCPA
jgi:RsiW-degrading membrane proteinase PrsW (M82 family)